MTGLPTPSVFLEFLTSPISRWLKGTLNLKGTKSLDWEYPLEKGMAPHSSIFAWEIPWTE